jgi:predicted amidohydrolase
MFHLNIALAQADLAWKDKTTNFSKFENWLENNLEQTDLVILPEMFATGFITEPEEVAEKMDGETVTWLKTQAQRYKCVIMGSAIIEENGKYYNRLIWADRNGEISTYDKRHLFTFGGEHKKFTGGTKKLVMEINGWKICPMVCYDLRFPVWAKNTYKNGTHEYDVLIYIANWPSARAHAFRQLLIARAIENQCFVVGVNRVGVDGKGLYYQGNSTVIDFQGNHLLEIKPDAEALEYTSLDYTGLQKARESFPVGADWDQFEIV